MAVLSLDPSAIQPEFVVEERGHAFLLVEVQLR